MNRKREAGSVGDDLEPAPGAEEKRMDSARKSGNDGTTNTAEAHSLTLEAVGHAKGDSVLPFSNYDSSVSRAPSDPPRSISDIPGLGPIRVRALQKAGWSSLNALRQADIVALMTVPGMSEVKARHIQQYLKPFKPEQLAATVQSDTTHAAVPETKTAVTEGFAVSGAPTGAAQVVQRATRAMGEVITVLLSPEAPQFRSRFLRILGQFAQCAESLATDAAHLSDEQQDRAVRRLRRAAKALSELTGVTAADRKAQGRLADTLEELTAKLAECRLST